MKYVIAFILTLLVLVTLAYFVLQIWDISLFNPQYLTKTYTTIGVLGVGAVVLTLIIAFFFGGNRSQYNKSATGVAQKKL